MALTEQEYAVYFSEGERDAFRLRKLGHEMHHRYAPYGVDSERQRAYLDGFRPRSPIWADLPVRSSDRRS